MSPSKFFTRCLMAFALSGVSNITISAAEPAQPTTLHTILKAQTYSVAVGDVVQIRYKTQATAVGIATLDVLGAAPILESVALVMMPLDPAKPEQQLPGAPYYVVALFKVVKAGKSNIGVTPVQNDGGRQKTFTFAIDAR